MVDQTASGHRGTRGHRDLFRFLLPQGPLRRSLHHRRRRLLLFLPTAHCCLAHDPAWRVTAVDTVRALRLPAALDVASRDRLSAYVGLPFHIGPMGRTALCAGAVSARA